MARWQRNGFVELDPESLRFVVRFVLEWGATVRDAMQWIVVISRQLAATMRSGGGKAAAEFLLWAFHEVSDHLRMQGTRALITPTAQESLSRQTHWLYVHVSQ